MLSIGKISREVDPKTGYELKYLEGVKLELKQLGYEEKIDEVLTICAREDAARNSGNLVLEAVVEILRTENKLDRRLQTNELHEFSESHGLIDMTLSKPLTRSERRYIEKRRKLAKNK